MGEKGEGSGEKGGGNWEWGTPLSTPSNLVNIQSICSQDIERGEIRKNRMADNPNLV